MATKQKSMTVAIETPESKIAEISKEVAKVEDVATHITIKSQKDVVSATEFLGGVKSRLKRIEELRKFFVAPLKEQAKKIDAMFGEQAAPLEQIETKVKRAIADYTLEQNRLAAKEEERLAKLRAAQDERREAKGLAPVAAPLPTVARPEATTKADGASATAMIVWKYEVVDINEVPRNLLRCEVKHASVQALIDTGVREIAGLRIYEDVQVRVSAK